MELRSGGRIFYVVGFGDLFEFGFSVLLVVRVLVRVPFHGELPVRLLQCIVFGASIYL